MLPEILFLYNPSSGDNPVTEHLDKLIELYQGRGYLMVIHRLEFSESDRETLRRVAPSCEHILIAGGDGSINYTVNLMKQEGIGIPVAILPSGTANDFATLLGMPAGVVESCRAILDGEIHEMDLGTVNGRYFVNVFSSGLFTDVSQKTPTAWKNNLGKVAYYINGIGDIPRFRKMELHVTTDGGDFHGNAIILFVFNGRTAGTLPLAYLSEGDDGFLDVLILKGDTPLDTLRTAVTYLPHMIQRKSYPSGIVHLRCRTIHAESERNEHTDMDGQPGPSFPVDIRCEHASLKVIMPRRRE